MHGTTVLRLEDSKQFTTESKKSTEKDPQRKTDISSRQLTVTCNKDLKQLEQKNGCNGVLKYLSIPK